MTLTQIWRLDDLILCVVVGIAFGVQTWRMRHELDGPRRLLCIGVLLFLLRDAEGLSENLAQDNPGGARLFFSTVLYLLVGGAVLQRKVIRDLDKP